MRTGLDFIFLKLSLEGWRVVVILAKLSHRVSTVKRGGWWGGGGGGESFYQMRNVYYLFIFYRIRSLEF